MSDESTKSSPFRPWGRQEEAVKALCAATPGAAKPKYPDMMRAVIDAGLVAINNKAKRAERAKR